MGSTPIPTEVYDTYWRFAAERMSIYYKRLAGNPGPWTDDPILRTYRFTNVYRAADRVSQYLIRQVQYRDDRAQAPAELFFRTLLFKFFNKIETWELIEHALGGVSWQAVDLDTVSRSLDEAARRGASIYNAAYIMPAPAFGFARKHNNHLALLRKMMEENLPARIERAATLADAYRLLLSYPGLGPFLAFQYAIDLNYSRFLNFQERDFVVAGPGALDGISKCFADTGDLTAEEIIFLMVERQETEFHRLGLQFCGLFGRPLQPIDCQNIFCEISKYARVAHPDVAGASGRKRIKQHYRPKPTPEADPYFPPKWGLTTMRRGPTSTHQPKML